MRNSVTCNFFRKGDASHHAGMDWRTLLICLVLLVMVFAVFGQSFNHGFFNIDDDGNIYSTPEIATGLSLKNLTYAFTHHQTGRWEPLAAISHQFDCQFLGTKAGPQHVMSVSIHALNAMLLFLALRAMTGSLWRSSFVAALFAVHPLRVEPVEWLSCRSELLCALFFMLILWSYTAYVKRSTWPRYVLVMLWFALGVISKPTFVTVPCLLLLLDYWPLRRVEGRMISAGVISLSGGWKSLQTTARAIFPLLLEKLPLILLLPIPVWMTLREQKMHMVDPVPQLPLTVRLWDAPVILCDYIRKLFAPRDLVFFYPTPAHGYPVWQFAISMIFLIAVSVTVIYLRRRRPYLIVGWFWYLGTLAPLLNVIPIPAYCPADRYTYLPLIGPCIALTWWLADITSRWGGRSRRFILTVIAGVSLFCLMVSARYQVDTWGSNLLLWTRTVELTKGNAIADYIRSGLLIRSGQRDEGVKALLRALSVAPEYADAYHVLGVELRKVGDLEGALAHFREYVKLRPKEAQGYNNIGVALIDLGRPEEALPYVRKALEIDPGSQDAKNNLAIITKAMEVDGGESLALRKILADQPSNPSAQADLGSALYRAGKSGEAVVHLKRALELEPGIIRARIVLGNALLRMGRPQEALSQYRMAIQMDPLAMQAIEIDPSDAEAHNILGTLFFSRGELGRSLEEFKDALSLEPCNSIYENNLAWFLTICPKESLRNGLLAIELARDANAREGNMNPSHLRTLAAAYAATGDYAKASFTMHQAEQAARPLGNASLIEVLRKEGAKYDSLKGNSL